MTIELTSQEAQNVRVALRVTMKQIDVDEDGMKTLLILSDKFVETAKEVVVDSKKDE
jgi:hypothetical protein